MTKSGTKTSPVVPLAGGWHPQHLGGVQHHLPLCVIPLVTHTIWAEVSLDVSLVSDTRIGQ